MSRTIRRKKTYVRGLLRCRFPEASNKLKKGHTKNNCWRCH